MKLSELVDITKLHKLTESFQDIIGVPCTLIDGGNSLPKPGKYNPLCAKSYATKSDVPCFSRWNELALALSQSKSFTSTCPLGLYDMALPVTIDGQLAAALLIGPFRTSHPNHEELQKIARELNVDEQAFIDEHTAAPVILPERIPALKRFLTGLSTLITDLGADNKRLATAEIVMRRAGDELEKTVATRTAELQETQRRLNDAQHIGEMGSFQLDLTNHECWWSDELYLLLGYDAANAHCSLDAFIDRIHPQEKQSFQEQFEKSVAQGKNFETELRILLPGTKCRWFFGQFTIDCDAEKKAHMARGTLRNITFRKEMELELLKANRLQQLILDNSIMGIALVKERKFMWLNNRAAELAQYSVEEMTGSPTRMVYMDDAHYKEVEKASRKAFALGKPYEAIQQLKRADGSSVWYRGVASLLDPENPHEGAVWIIEDVSGHQEAHQALTRSRRELQSIFNNSQVGMMLIRKGHRITRANKRLAEVLGYDSAKSMKGISLQDIHLSQKDYEDFIQNHYEKLTTKTLNHVESTLRCKEGSAVWCSISAKAMDTAIPPDLEKGVILVVEDISQQKLAEKALRASETRFRAIFAHAGVGICTLDKDGKIFRVNNRMEMLVGYSDYDLVGLNISEITHPKDHAKDKELNSRLWMGDIPMYVREKRYIRRGGAEVWGRVTTTMVCDDDQQPRYILQVTENIHERKRLEAELVRMAKTDALTGLKNRYSLLEHGTAEFDRFKRYQTPCSILMLDVDYFKTINDTYGHQAGDAVLKALAGACTQILRKTDVFGRLGGEEFAAILVQTPLDEAYNVAERMRKAIEKERVPSGNDTIEFTISIGVTQLQESDTSLEVAQHRADSLMYRAKEQGRNQVIKG